MADPHPSTPPPPDAAPPARASRRRVVALIGLLVALSIAALATDLNRQRQHREAVTWGTAELLTQPSDRPTLVRFSADWCPPCLVMKREVFSDAQLAADLQARFNVVDIDLTRPSQADQQLADAYGADYLPTFVLLTPGGAEAARFVGGADLQAFTNFLDRYTDGPSPPASNPPT